MKRHIVNLKEYYLINDIHSLYLEAFPSNERLPWWLIKILLHRKYFNLFAYINENHECESFTLEFIYKNMVFVWYLAVNSHKRSQGLGSKIIELLKYTHRDKILFLDIEPTDGTAINAIQRTKRRNFYLKHGFKASDYQLNDHIAKYDILYFGSNHFNATQFGELLKNMTWGLLSEKSIRKVK